MMCDVGAIWSADNKLLKNVVEREREKEGDGYSNDLFLC